MWVSNEFDSRMERKANSPGWERQNASIRPLLWPAGVRKAAKVESILRSVTARHLRQSTKETSIVTRAPLHPEQPFHSGVQRVNGMWPSDPPLRVRRHSLSLTVVEEAGRTP